MAAATLGVWARLEDRVELLVRSSGQSPRLPKAAPKAAFLDCLDQLSGS